MQTDEQPLDRAAGGGPTAEQAAEAQRRALNALALMLPGGAAEHPDDAADAPRRSGTDHRLDEGGASEIVIDLTDAATGHRWATPARAARLAGVPPATVRQWARRGVILRERRPGGGFLVDVEAAVDAATHAGPGGDPPSDGALAKLMRLQRDRALGELERVDREVEDAVVEIEFLRHQLDFAEAENRGLRVALERAQGELAAARAGALPDTDDEGGVGSDGADIGEDTGVPPLIGTRRGARPARPPLPPAVFSILDDDSGERGEGGPDESAPPFTDDLTPAAESVSRWRRRRNS